MKFCQFVGCNSRSRRGLACFSLMGGLLLSSLFLSGCGSEDEATAEAPPRPPSLVRVAQLDVRPVSRKIIAVGNVTPVRTSVVASGANGVVQFLQKSPLKDEDLSGESDPNTEVTPTNSPESLTTEKSPSEAEPETSNEFPEIEIGQFVAKGTVLSVLRMEATNNELAEARAILLEREHKLDAETAIHPKELEHADAMVKMAEAVKTNAKSKWERTRTLHGRGVANETELEDALEKWEAAEQALIAAQKNREQVRVGLTIEQAQASRDAQAAHIDYLGSEKAKRTTRAPFDGFVVQEHTYVGQWLSKGDPVVTLAKMDEVDVMVNIDQADIPYVRLGQSVKVTVQGTDQSEWPGHVVQIVPRSDWEQGSRGFPVVVRIPNRIETIEVANPDGKGTHLQKVPVLKAGMMARVTILGPEVDTLLAPKDSLVRTTRGTYLFMYEPGDKNAQLDPDKPTMGSVQQIRIVADLSMSDGEMIGVRPEQELSDHQNPLKRGVWVVTEGGERLRVHDEEVVTDGPERLAPIQDNINALSPMKASKK